MCGWEIALNCIFFLSLTASINFSRFIRKTILTEHFKCFSNPFSSSLFAFAYKFTKLRIKRMKETKRMLKSHPHSALFSTYFAYSTLIISVDDNCLLLFCFVTRKKICIKSRAKHFDGMFGSRQMFLASREEFLLHLACHFMRKAIFSTESLLAERLAERKAAYDVHPKDLNQHIIFKRDCRPPKAWNK